MLLLSLLHAMQSTHPQLWASLCHVYVHLGKAQTLLAEAMANMKISSRGDIRKSNNVIDVLSNDI